MGIARHRNFVAGEFVEATGAGSIPVLNPAKKETLAEIPDTSAQGVESAVEAASAAQKAWEARPAIERAGFVREIAAKIRENVNELAHAIVLEQGKTRGLAEVEVNFTADYKDYMAEWARRIEGEIVTSDRRRENILLFRHAIGVIGGILPWNFPFFLIARKMAPALVTGNTVVIKPSEETPNNANLFARLVAESDLPAGVFNLVHGGGATTGAALSSNPGIGMVSFTGSVETGSAVMEAAAKNLTKVNLELGGKAPAIVLSDADVDLAVGAIKALRVINSGQVCNCAERVYVDSKVAYEFVSKLASHMSETSYGDPVEDPTVEMGPLINQAGLQKVEGMVDRAVADGAEVVTGGKVADLEPGAYFEPTVLVNCRQDMEIMQKEIFGPVVPINFVDTVDEAIERANDSAYGLTSSIYTSSITTAMRACNEIRFGETYINRENFEAMQGFHAGVRKSGIGGADGKHGLYEYMQTHAVYIQH